MQSDEDDGDAWRLRAVQLALTSWGATLIVLLTLNKDSWLGQQIVRVESKPNKPADFLDAVAPYVAVAAAGVLICAFFLLAKQRTRDGWAGWLAPISFSMMATFYLRLILHTLAPSG